MAILFSYPLTANQVYIAPVSMACPASATSFPVILNPCRLLNLDYDGDGYGLDINGRVFVKDISNYDHRVLELEFYLSSIDNPQLMLLNKWWYGRQKLWVIDGKYNNLYVDNATRKVAYLTANYDSKTEKVPSPATVAYSGYISSLAGDFVSGTKMNEDGYIKLILDDVVRWADTTQTKSEAITFDTAVT